MNKTLETIKKRRSIRQYKDLQITDEELQTILEAGTYAPNAAGRQSPIIVACQNPEILNNLWKLNMEEIKKIAAIRPPMNQNTKKEMPPMSTFYGAPTLITIFAPKNWYNFTLDCAMSAQNIMLAANSLNIGSCVIARAKEVFESEYGKELKTSWGIDEDYEAKIHVILGYIDGQIPEAKPRLEGKIKIFK